MTWHPTVLDYVVTWPWGCWVSLNESLSPFLACLVHGHPSNRRSLYRLPSPWLLLPLATNTIAVVGVKKLVSAPSLAVKEMCVFVVCLFTKSVLLSLAVIDIMGWVVCVCFLWLKLLVEMRAKPPFCSLIGWMTGQECDGRSTINFPVVGKGHGVTALWSTIKSTRQIGWGGRRSAGERGETKTGTEMQLNITQGRTKALWQPRDTTATPAHTHTHTGMHTNISLMDYLPQQRSI